jgi:hypothetical protein
MGNQRLSAVSILSIEHETANSLNYDDIVTAFASAKVRCDERGEDKGDKNRGARTTKGARKGTEITLMGHLHSIHRKVGPVLAKDCKT